MSLQVCLPCTETDHEMDPCSLLWFLVVAVLKVCYCPAATREKSRSLFPSKRRKKPLGISLRLCILSTVPSNKPTTPNYSSAVLYFFPVLGSKSQRNKEGRFTNHCSVSKLEHVSWAYNETHESGKKACVQASRRVCNWVTTDNPFVLCYNFSLDEGSFQFFIWPLQRVCESLGNWSLLRPLEAVQSFSPICTVLVDNHKGRNKPYTSNLYDLSMLQRIATCSLYKLSSSCIDSKYAIYFL